MLDTEVTISGITPIEIVSTGSSEIISEVTPGEQTYEPELEDERFDITEPVVKDPPSRIQRNHPSENIIGDIDEGRKTRDKIRLNYQDMVRYVCYTSCIEPKNVK